MQQPTPSNRLRPFRPTPFGRYTLLMPLSMGGMGEIFLARIDGPQGFEKLCVIKKILPHLAEDKDFVSRFGNEARTLVKLTHGSIAQVLDMGQHNGEPYLALEYIDGKDLRKVGARFRERGMPVPSTFVLFVMARVLDALAYAHRKRDDDDKEIGLVHRDMSPQNILISYEGEVKIIDFGLAKSTLNASKTNPSIILGKFLYMSPEQAKHAKVDRRSDLYAVGLCLYELIAGKNPFEDVPPHALMAAVANPNIAHVQQIDPLVPSNIAQIVMKALAVDPAQRYQTAEELRGKLLGCLLEIDPSAGPESCTRFMRDIFSAEYLAERKLLAQLKDAARLEVRPDAQGDVGSARPATVRPLVVAKPNARVEPPPADVATPGPTDLRRYGMEPTMPRAQVVSSSPLSFAPTPKVSGIQADRSHEGDRETVPGIVIDRGLLTGEGATGADDDLETGPHLQANAPPSAELADELPTNPLSLPVARAGPQLVAASSRLGSAASTATTAPSIEPVTTQNAAVVVGPSDEELPSVMVTGLHSQSAPGGRATPSASKTAQRAQTGGVLVPAASVRTPAVVGPLPKALEGKIRPDETTATDRTRGRRSSLVVVLVPLFAFLGLAAFVGYSIVKEQNESEADDRDATSSMGGKRDVTDTSKRKITEYAEVEAEPATIEVAAEELSPLPLKEPAPAPPPNAKTRKLPISRAGKELAVVRKLFNRKLNVLEQHQANSLSIKLDGLEQRVFDVSAANEAKFLSELADVRKQIENAK